MNSSPVLPQLTHSNYLIRGAPIPSHPPPNPASYAAAHQVYLRTSRPPPNFPSPSTQRHPQPPWLNPLPRFDPSPPSNAGLETSCDTCTDFVNLLNEKNQEIRRLKARILQLEPGKTGPPSHFLPMIRTSKLQPELLYMIIDHLRNDKQSLLSCSLVSRTWLHSGLPYLWRTVSVVADFEGFIAFLRARPHVRRYIRELSLFGLAGTSLDVRSPGRPRIHINTIQSILSYLPYTRTLRLQALQFQMFNDPDMHLKGRFQLDQLYIRDSGANDETTCDVAGILGLFSQIGALQLHHVSFGDLPITQLECLVARVTWPRVHSVVVVADSHVSMYSALEYLGITQSAEAPLHSIEVRGPGDAEVKQLGDLLESVKMGLHHFQLELDFEDIWESGHVHHDLLMLIGSKLGLCSKLQSFELDLKPVDLDDDDEEKAAYSSVFRMISRGPQSLVRIAIHFHGYNPMRLWKEEDSAPNVDWEMAAMNLTALEKLERVVINFHGSEGKTLKSRKRQTYAQAVLRAFRKEAPALAKMDICEVGLNSSFYRLKDGSEIPNDPVHRCKTSVCRGP